MLSCRGQRRYNILCQQIIFLPVQYYISHALLSFFSFSRTSHRVFFHPALPYSLRQSNDKIPLLVSVGSITCCTFVANIQSHFLHYKYIIFLRPQQSLIAQIYFDYIICCGTTKHSSNCLCKNSCQNINCILFTYNPFNFSHVLLHFAPYIIPFNIF